MTVQCVEDAERKRRWQISWTQARWSRDMQLVLAQTFTTGNPGNGLRTNKWQTAVRDTERYCEEWQSIESCDAAQKGRRLLSSTSSSFSLSLSSSHTHGTTIQSSLPPWIHLNWGPIRKHFPLSSLTTVSPHQPLHYRRSPHPANQHQQWRCFTLPPHFLHFSWLIHTLR